MDSIAPQLRFRFRQIGTIAAISAGVLTLAGCATPGESTPEPTELVAPTVSETPDESATPEPSPEPEPSESAEPTDPAEGRSPVTVAITGINVVGNSIKVRSFLPTVIADGTCTVTATNDHGDKLEYSSAALPDAQSTVCPTATIHRAAAGTWHITVTFENDEYYGVSEPKTVEVAQ